MGLKQYFIKQVKVKPPQVGLMADDRGMSLAYKSNTMNLPDCQYFNENDQSQIRDWLHQRGLTEPGFQWVLGDQQYKIYQLEPPQVPEEEMHQALLFHLNDRLDFPVNEAQLDYFEIPKDAQRDGRRRVNAVVANLPMLKQQLEKFAGLGLQPSVIEIPELTIKRKISDREAMDKGICFVNYHDNFIKLMIYRKQMLYLTRKAHIPSWDACLTETPGNASENLVLEIQRTLDYYQSQMGQPPVVEIVLPQWTDSLQPLADYLQSNIGIQTNILKEQGFEGMQLGMNASRQMSMAAMTVDREH